MGTYCCCDCRIGDDDFSNPVRDTGWKSPASTATGVSGDDPWSNHANAKASDDAYTTASVDGDSPSEFLQAFDYSFGIPAGATIVGVEVRVERKASAAGDVTDSGVYLHTNGSGAVSGWNLASMFVTWDTADEWVTYGHSTATWGWTLTPAVVNASNFGVAIQAVGKTLGTYRTASVDHIEMKVYYEGPGTGPGPGWTVDAGSWYITPDDGGMLALALSTEDSNARVLYDTTHPDGVASHIVSAFVRGTQEGDCLRLSMGGSLYIELQLGAAYTGTGAYLRLIGPSGILKEAASIAIPNSWYYLQGCYHYGDAVSSQALAGRFWQVGSTGAVPRFLEDVTVASTDTQVGLATGTMVGTAYFDSFTFDAHYSVARPNCEECKCPNCTVGTEPNEVEVVLAGIVDQSCDACESLNASYILPRVAPCTFEDEFEVDIGDPTNPYYAVCDGITLHIKAVVGWMVNVTIKRFGIPIETITFRSSSTLPVDCTLPPTLSKYASAGSPICNLLSMTAALNPL